MKYLLMLSMFILLDVPAVVAQDLETNLSKYQKIEPMQSQIPLEKLSEEASVAGTEMLAQDPIDIYLSKLTPREKKEASEILVKEWKPIMLRIGQEVKSEQPDPNKILPEVVALKNCMKKLKAVSSPSYAQLLRFLPNYKWGSSIEDKEDFSLVEFIDQFSVNAGEEDQSELVELNKEMKKFDLTKLTKEEVRRKLTEHLSKK